MLHWVLYPDDRWQKVKWNRSRQLSFDSLWSLLDTAKWDHQYTPAIEHYNEMETLPKNIGLPEAIFFIMVNGSLHFLRTP